jgi:hypothetical protein
MPQNLQKDLKEFIELLNGHQVQYLVVGAFSLAFHGIPRFTGDIDLFVDISPENAEKLERVINDFGFAATGLNRKDFLEPHQVIQLGMAPHRIDLLTGIDGVTFAEAWMERVDGFLGDVPVPFISRNHLIQNKRAAGRPQDLVDIQTLEKRKPPEKP